MSAAVGTRSRGGTPWGALAALAIGLVGGYLLAGSLCGVAAPAAPVLDARLRVASEGAVFAFTVVTPRDVRVTVQLEGCCKTTRGEAVLSRLLPAKRPKLIYEPEVEEELRMTIGVEPTTSAPWTLEHAGVYALRIPSIPTAMGERAPVAWVRVVRVNP